MNHPFSLFNAGNDRKTNAVEFLIEKNLMLMASENDFHEIIQFNISVQKILWTFKFNNRWK